MKRITPYRTFCLGAALAGLWLAASSVHAQIGEDSPLAWHWTAVPATAGTNEKEVEITFDIDIAPGWILYSSDFTPSLFGPRATKLKLAETQAYRASRAVEAVAAKSGTLKDAAGEAHYTYFSGKGQFKQRVAVSDPSAATEIRGSVRGQTCFEEKGVCQLFVKDFAVTVK